ncbi:MAG: lycopene cyclase domain-containing protein [Halobacteriales archaeon]
MTTLTYLGFHAVFILPPLAVLATTARPLANRRRAMYGGIGLMAALALFYTTPWDSYLIWKGVWGYGEGNVLATLGYMPLEEYLFVLLQPAVTGLWLCHVRIPTASQMTITVCERVIGVLAGAAISLIGVGLFVGTSTHYMGAILAWAGPVFAIQWGFGWPYLRRHWRTVFVGIGVPTLYLSIADRIAIGHGIWHISPTYTTGITVLGLPIEEGAFFLITNAFIVEGIVLLLWVIER